MKINQIFLVVVFLSQATIAHDHATVLLAPEAFVNVAEEPAARDHMCRRMSNKIRNAFSSCLDNSARCVAKNKAFFDFAVFVVSMYQKDVLNDFEEALLKNPCVVDEVCVVSKVDHWINVASMANKIVLCSSSLAGMLDFIGRFYAYVSARDFDDHEKKAIKQFSSLSSAISLASTFVQDGALLIMLSYKDELPTQFNQQLFSLAYCGAAMLVLDLVANTESFKLLCSGQRNER